MQQAMILFMLLTGSIADSYGYNSPADDFKLVKNDRSISLYERWFTNARGEQVRELKAVFTVQSTIPSITALLADASRGARWNQHAKTYYAHPAGNSWITYIRYGTPWPFDDQDCCLRFSLNSNTPVTLIHFESTTHQQYPVRKNITRLTGIKGRWELQPAANGSVRITYFVSSNRNAQFPRVIADPVVRNNIFDTMTAFKNLLETNL
jgi:hypothetical protein